MPPSRWQMGRIIETLPSRDGVVRAAKIRTLTGEYTRPILKLALLLEESDKESTADSSTSITKQPNINLSALYDKLIKERNIHK